MCLALPAAFSAPLRGRREVMTGPPGDPYRRMSPFRPLRADIVASRLITTITRPHRLPTARRGLSRLPFGFLAGKPAPRPPPPAAPTGIDQALVTAGKVGRGVDRRPTFRNETEARLECAADPSQNVQVTFACIP